MNEEYIRLNGLSTPCYIFYPKELTDGTELLFSSLKKYWGNYIAGYSFKTNSLPYFVREIKKLGYHAEVVSADEYRLALHLGYDNIIYNGPVKDKETFFDALKRPCIINLDAERELSWLEEFTADNKTPKAKIGLRVNFDLESMCPGETSSGENGSRFGFSYEKGGLKRAIECLQDLNIKPDGLHLHSSSKTRSVGIYEAIAKMAVKLKEEYSLKLSYVDVGGGFFGGMPGRPQFNDYIKAMSAILKNSYDPGETALIMEPGTSLASRSFDYITRVIDVKDTGYGRFVTVDGSRTDVDPLHTKTSYLYDIIKKDPDHAGHYPAKQIICGYTCMEGDRLMQPENEKELCPGDYIRIKKAGGYTMSLTPLFIRYFPDVYMETDSGHTNIRKHWGPEEYIG